MDHASLRIFCARNFFARLGGLIVLAPLRDREALCLMPCSSVHTFFMRYAIDVAFLDRNGRVIKLLTLAPWQAAYCRGAHAALELRAGQAVAIKLEVGSVIAIDQGMR